MYKKTLLIDLDGTLNQYGDEKYDENYIPKIKQGAKEFIEKLYLTQKFELVLFTTRNLLLSVKWLIDNNIDIFFKDATNVKLPAHLCIDDRAICFNGDYLDTLRKVENFNVWWN